jgi:hypothetical protein
MKVTTLRLPEDLHEALETEAGDRETSLAAYVRTILHQRDDLDLVGGQNTQPNTPPNTSPNTDPNTLPDTLVETIAALDERVSELEERLDQQATATREPRSEQEGPPQESTESDESATHDDRAAQSSQVVTDAPERSVDDAEAAPRSAIDEVLTGWRPGRNRDKREQQLAAGRAVLEWLREQKVASAADFREDLEPEHPVSDQSAATWWKKTGREALKRAQEAGLVEFVDGRNEWTWTGE